MRHGDGRKHKHLPTDGLIGREVGFKMPFLKAFRKRCGCTGIIVRDCIVADYQ